jgi:endonuclease/exonuclease/phosphatase family metal-dependent hydrolase
VLQKSLSLFFSPDGTLEVRFLSYNLFIRPPGIRNNQDDFKAERLEEFIKVIKDFDIIGLQEMFSTFSSRQQQLIDAAMTIGFKYHVKPKPHGPLSPFLVDGGLLLLSKYPVIESDSLIFIQGVQSDGLASKGALFARIQLGRAPSSSLLACFPNPKPYLTQLLTYFQRKIRYHLASTSL